MDTSAWYAVADSSERGNERAQEILVSDDALLTSDHVLVETWLLIRHRIGRRAAEDFWYGLRSGVASIEPIAAGDLEVAWAIGETFRDQDFSIVDRTSFAVMQRLGVSRVASFDDDFAVFRFGRNLERAFEVLR